MNLVMTLVIKTMMIIVKNSSNNNDNDKDNTNFTFLIPLNNAF